MKSILKTILYISFFLYLSVVSAQSICSISEAELTYNTANCLSGYSGIKLESENQKSIDNILNTIGIANANFVTKSCKDIYNAFAYYDSYNKIRYIAVDENFIYNLNPKNYQWTSVFVLAHEIAHHLNGHTITGIKSDNERRQRELDCDKFAGFAIRKLGGSIESLKKAIKSIPHPKNNTGSHPTYERRLASALEGYKMGVEEEKNILKKYSAALEQYFEKRHYEKSLSLARENFFDYLLSNNKLKLEESLSNYLKVIGEAPNDASVYSEIASVYILLLDYHNAEIYTKKAYAINKRPEFLIDIYDCCTQYHIMNQEYISKSCNQHSEDLKKIDYKDIANIESLKKLARFYAKSGELFKAEQILNFAIEKSKEQKIETLSNSQFSSYSILVLSDIYSDLSVIQLRQGQYQTAYTNILKSLELSKISSDKKSASYDMRERADKYNNIVLLSNKAVIENRLGMWEQSNKTYSEMIATPTDIASRIFFTKGNNYYNLEKYTEAIKSYSMAIRIEQDQELLAREYFERGRAKYKNGDIKGACSDFSVASDKGDELGDKAYKTLCN